MKRNEAAICHHAPLPNPPRRGEGVQIEIRDVISERILT